MTCPSTVDEGGKRLFLRAGWPTLFCSVPIPASAAACPTH